MKTFIFLHFPDGGNGIFSSDFPIASILWGVVDFFPVPPVLKHSIPSDFHAPELKLKKLTHIYFL
jgi:hypothetical protein